MPPKRARRKVKTVVKTTASAVTQAREPEQEQVPIASSSHSSHMYSNGHIVYQQCLLSY